jgi:glycerol-3-phosphate cytidylyltransferase
MKKVIAYGTFDLITPGHIALLEFAKSLGDYLIVAISTDEFNEIKHKHSYLNYEERKRVMEAIRYVDEVIPEENWDQKVKDITERKIDTLVMGSDWEGSEKFKYLEEYCNVVFFKRVSDFSSTNYRNFIKEHSDENK